MYWMMLGVLLVCALYEAISEKNVFFRFLFVLITVLLVFRYGQGSDYLDYKFLYYYPDHHTEIGYHFIEKIFMWMGIPFELYMAILSAFMMWCVYRGLERYSHIKCLSLLLLYPTVYLVYFLSAIRQGIVISFFLGFMLEWIENERVSKYLTACVFLGTIHSAALILLILPLVTKMKSKTIVAIGIVGTLFSYLLYKIDVNALLFFNFTRLKYYLEGHISFWGLAERTVMLIGISFLYYKAKEDKVMSIMYKIYLAGYFITAILFVNDLVGMRLAIPMKALEIFLIPNLLYRNEKTIKALMMACVFVYTVVMVSKNLWSFAYQSHYEITGANPYPYQSIWSGNEDAEKMYDSIIEERGGDDKNFGKW